MVTLGFLRATMCPQNSPVKLRTFPSWNNFSGRNTTAIHPYCRWNDILRRKATANLRTKMIPLAFLPIAFLGEDIFGSLHFH